MATPFNELVRVETASYLAQVDPDSPPPPSQIEQELLDATNTAIALENADRPKSEKLSVLVTLSVFQIAMVIEHVHRAKRIGLAGRRGSRDLDVVGIYQSQGERAGLYDIENDNIRALARQFDNSLTNAKFEEVLRALADICPRVILEYDPNCVAVANGVYDRTTGALEDFSPNRVLVHKTSIDHVADPPVVHIEMPDGLDWEFNAWLTDLFCLDASDPDQVAEAEHVARFVKQCMAACLRPGTSWDKVALFYATEGSNGKGTVVQTIQNILGEGASLSIALDKFAEDAYLEKTPGIMAVLTHENPVNAFAKDVSRWKAFTSGDSFRVNRKYKQAIELAVNCFQIQCFNSKFRTPDTSDSFYRRVMVVPFLKTFKGAVERKYIKDDYLARQDVLERIQWELLRMDFDTFDVPATVVAATEELQRDNDPVQTFWEEMASELVWDVVPAKFVFDLFAAWTSRNKMGALMGRNTFYDRLQQVLRTQGGWVYQEGKVRLGSHLDAAEPLVATYNLASWQGLDLPMTSNGGWGARARQALPALATNVIRRQP